VIALYYALFAVMGGAPGALAAESIPIAGFILFAILGFKWNLWFLVVGLAGHGVFRRRACRRDRRSRRTHMVAAFLPDVRRVMAVYLAGLILLGRLAGTRGQPESMSYVSLRDSLT